MDKYIPSDLLRHICKYHNPYEEIFNKCLRELQWNMFFDDCKFILQVKLFSSSLKETYVVSSKVGNEIHCITLEPFYTGEYQRLFLKREEFMDVYWVQVITTKSDIIEIEAFDNEWLIKKHTYDHIPSILNDWEMDYEDYLEKIQSEEE